MSGDWIEKIRENAFVRIHHTNVLMWKIADGNRVLISKNASHGEAEGEKCSLCCTNFASPKKSELLRYLRQLFQRVFTIITDKSSMLQWWQMTSWGSKMVRQSDRTVCAKWFISEWSCDDLSDNHDFTIESSQSINAQFDAVIATRWIWLWRQLDATQVEIFDFCVNWSTCDFRCWWVVTDWWCLCRNPSICRRRIRWSKRWSMNPIKDFDRRDARGESWLVRRTDRRVCCSIWMSCQKLMMFVSKSINS